MTNANSQDQFVLFKKTAQQSGMSGTAYIDFNPADGFLRIKLRVTPPEYQSALASNFAQALAQISQAFGLQVKTHQSGGGEAGVSK